MSICIPLTSTSYTASWLCGSRYGGVRPRGRDKNDVEGLVASFERFTSCIHDDWHSQDFGQGSSLSVAALTAYGSMPIPNPSPIQARSRSWRLTEQTTLASFSTGRLRTHCSSILLAASSIVVEACTAIGPILM